MSRIVDLMDTLCTSGSAIALNDGTRACSYAQLDAQVSSWLDWLDQLDARRVAYRLPNGLEWVALDLALLCSGRVAVPMPDFFSPAQERHVLACSGIDTYVSASPVTAPGFLPTAHRNGLTGFRTQTDRVPDLHPGTAKVTFTSGTTGAPKGVCLSADHLLATASAICAALDGNNIRQHLCVLPLSLLLENVAGIYANLLNGSAIAVPALTSIGISGSSGLDLHSFVTAQHSYRPQSLILVPQLLLALTAAGEFGLSLPDGYRFIAVGGGKVPLSLLNRAAKLGLPVYEGYGLTECGSVVALNLPGASRPGSVGRPLPHVSIELCGEEIQVRGQSMLGYLGDAHAAPGIATGDLGELDDDGFLYVRGRTRNCFITSFGRNVSPEWIESELQSDIAIAHAVVFGEALPGNVALLVPRGAPTDQQVQQAVDAANGRLPDYARIAAWQSIPAADFERSGCLTDNGRPRRREVASRYAANLETLYAQIKERTYAALSQA